MLYFCNSDENIDIFTQVKVIQIQRNCVSNQRLHSIYVDYYVYDVQNH